jgi:predicted NBD/HSP70 family sugar kinase
MPGKTLDSSGVRQQHTTLVLARVQAEREISRADLARRLGLARSTVSAIVDGLLEAGLVKELRPGASGGGRRPMLLTLDDAAFHLVGVDIGATHVTVAVTNLKAEVLAREDRPWKVREDPNGTLALVEELVGRALTECRTGRRALVGIGVAVPSPVDMRMPGHVSPVVLPAWSGVDVAERLSRRFGVPVRMDNDANLGALWEARWGQAARVDSLAYVKVATGVGAGLVFDGRIHRGTRGVAGELGHLSIDTSGPPCTCGLRGCLNVLVGTEPLLARARARAKAAGRRAPRLERVGDLVDAGLAGDEVAVECLDYAGRTLGLGLAMLLNLVNPATVVVGGGIVRAGELLLEPLRRTVARHSFSENISHARIVASMPGAAATARGAATLVMDAAFEEPGLFFRPPVKRGGRAARQPAR